MFTLEDEFLHTTSFNCCALRHVCTVCLVTNAETDLFWKVFFLKVILTFLDILEQILKIRIYVYSQV